MKFDIYQREREKNYYISLLSFPFVPPLACRNTDNTQQNPNNQISTTDTEKVIEIKFANAGEGLVSLSGTSEASGFVCGKAVHPYSSTCQNVSGEIISADTVRVTVPADAVYIGYACMQLTATSDDVLIPQLYNSHDLPPLAFYLQFEEQ